MAGNARRAVVAIAGIAAVVALALGGWPGSGASAATARPVVHVTAPAEGTTVALPGALALNGSATDDVAVVAVKYAVRDTVTTRWYQADGKWGTARVDFPATLASGGQPGTEWQASWTPPGAGSYLVRVFAVDDAGTLSGPVVRNFTVTAPTPPRAPNVVVVMTDDQRYDDIAEMPIVQRDLVGRGVSFDDAVVVNPWCCPSRATFLTGQYSHTHHVYTNSSPYGGFSAFQDTSTLATKLRAAGYRTALVGKYFNGYKGSYVPPGWDRWVSFSGAANEGGAYYDYTLNRDGALTTYGHEAADYSTDVLSASATAFIDSAPADRPVFLFFAPFGPHGQPEPAPRHLNVLRRSPVTDLPSFNEADVSDKPAYIQSLPLLTDSKATSLRNSRRHIRETLLSVDDAVGSMLAALERTGRLRDTVFVFTSDHGKAVGEHRFTKKEAPYEEIIRIPLVIRADAVTDVARHDPALVANIDVAPTLAALAGVALDAPDGVSLVGRLAGGGTVPRPDVLVEHKKGGTSDPVPSYCAVRNPTAKFVRYQTGETELYDLTTDPFELVNRATDPGYATLLTTLTARTRVLCTPRPPGYGWP